MTHRIRLPSFGLAILLAISLCSHVPAQAEPPPSQEAARQASAAGKWDEAGKLWAQVALGAPGREETSAIAAYNAGTSFLLGSNIGLGVAWLEKAHSLDRWDRATRKNLARGRALLEKSLGEGKSDPASNWFEDAIDFIGPSLAEAFLALLGIFSIILAYRRRDNWAGTAPHFSALALVMIGLFALNSGFYRAAAVVTEPMSLHTGPSPQYPEVVRVETGTKLRVRSASTPEFNAAGANPAGRNWLQVQVFADTVAWAPETGLLRL